jgi:hypothetical protein
MLGWRAAITAVIIGRTAQRRARPRRLSKSVEALAEAGVGRLSINGFRDRGIYFRRKRLPIKIAGSRNRGIQPITGLVGQQ